MTIAKVFGVALALVLAGCSGPPLAQYLIDPPASSLRLQPLVASVEIRDVSLPRYAAADEISLRGPDGAVRAIRGSAWADVPQRTVTRTLASNIGTILDNRVAAEPWPFAEPPAVEVTVLVDRMLAGADGIFRLTGQYAVAPRDAAISDRSGRFDIAKPIQADSLNAIAAANGAALVELSEIIARRLAR